jgi:hypothetical protein
VNLAALQVRRDDLLTKTTLLIASGLSAAEISQLVRSLQRVPGVLTAQADAGSARAFVQHDEGVKASSLVAAATSGNAPARIVSDTRPQASRPLATASSGSSKRSRDMAAVAVACILASSLIEIALPNSPEKRWLVITPVISLWVFLLFGAFSDPRS